MKNRVFKKALSFVMTLALLLTSFLGLGQYKASAETILTVSQAIANNTGTGTVEGYIVGVTTSGSGGNATYSQQGPFTVDTNIAIADSPTETNSKNIMPVQLVSGTAIRADLSLKAHPENLGKKVRITGTLALYYTVPALKTPTAAQFVDNVTPPTGPTFVSIADAKKQVGKKVIVEGIVTADNTAIGGGKLSTYVQDATSGINLYAYDETQFPNLKEGDKVRVTGTITEYKDLTEITPSASSDLEVLSTGNVLPSVKPLNLADLASETTGEPSEGSLVKVTAYVDSLPTTPSGGGYNINVYDAGFNGTTLRVLVDTNIYPTLEAGKWYEITAILSQYSSYQLIPRKASDVKALAEQPAPPKPESLYSSVIKDTVDGDTAHLINPVLGATTVRFLSIDTPETNFEGQSQGYHGEQAKAMLKELLKPGTPVEVEVADKPFDGYGRLLAHIYANGMDVNKEMVRLGMAVPYFIWPNMNHFEDYAVATQEAIDNNRGIWDPANPLEQLPYEFRFDSRGGPDKYVGDFFTQKYVSPERWEEIPVQNRVFFFTEQDAKTAGYTFAPEKKPTIPVQLLSINDLHGKIDQTYSEDINGDKVIDGKFGRMDYLATYVKQREATNPNTLLVHAGDAVGGSSPVSALFQDEPTIEILEAMGFDVGTLGNHELDEGTAEMMRLINGGTHPRGTENYDGINFPMIAANVVYKANGEHVLPPYAIKDIAGIKIGFVGVVTRSTAGMVMPAGIQDIEFTDETQAVNQAVAELKAQGIKAIVVLAHLDAVQSGDTITGQAADLANRVDDEVDVIFAAHNHKIVNGTVDNKLIVQAYEYGKAFVDVDLEIDPDSQDIVSKRGEVVYVKQEGVTPDAEISSIIANYENRIAPIMNQVIGDADIPMTGGYASTSDNALGNLIADSMRTAMHADFAMMNGGGIRDNLNQGPITWGELFNILPFNNVLMTVEIKGADLTAILNAQLSKFYGGDYSVSGLKYTWDPATTKVVSITFPDGSPIDPNATYTLAVNNFMATSTSFKYAPIGQRGQNPVTGPEDLAALVAYVENYGQPFAYEADGRIAQIKPAPTTTSTIAEARQAGLDNLVTIEGVVTSKPGVFGGKSFYMQDATGGTYVYQNLYDVAVGDVVKLTGTTAETAGEFRLKGITALEKVGHVDETELLVLTAGQIGKVNEGQLVKTKFATIYDLHQVNTNGTFEFTAKQGDATVVVHVDYRTGLSMNAFHNGDVVDLRGISSSTDGVIELKVVDTKGINVFPNSKKKS